MKSVTSKFTDDQRELINFLNEDFHWLNQAKALKSLQDKNLEIIRDVGDYEDELLIQTNESAEKIENLCKRIVARRSYKRKLFASLESSVRTVMEMRYLCYMPYSEISRKTLFSESSVYRKHYDAIRLLSLILGEWELKNEEEDRT